MRKRIGIFLASAALGFVAGGAMAGMKNIENAYEVTAQQVSLPAVATGQLVVTSCSGCKPVTLRVTEATQFLAAGTAVSLEQMREALHGPGAGKRLLTVFYRLDNNVVTRVVLSAG
ncbi:MAG: hypothetical protein BroJett010_09240 [Gammaproteobacteria bacterium]|nr:MAG: hypothetical protein BroJett010_09240 [Gammaproteobacteria bacterium]